MEKDQLTKKNYDGKNWRNRASKKRTIGNKFPNQILHAKMRYSYIFPHFLAKIEFLQVITLL